MKIPRVSSCVFPVAAVLFPGHLLLAQGPVNPPIAPPVAPQTLITSKPWKCIGDSWFAVRIFSMDGTFKTVGLDADHGTWALSGGAAIVISFADGHKDTLSLPLNPLGTDGIDKDGKHFTAIMGKALPVGASSPLNFSSSLDSPKSKTSHSALDSLPPPVLTPAQQQQNAASTALLVSAPWKIIGKSWARLRNFTAGGLFTTDGDSSEHGQWSISNNQVVLVFASDGHHDTLTLPLDPKGTDGTDSNGTPTFAILQATPATPALSAPPQNSTGPTPPPFGTQGNGR